MIKQRVLRTMKKKSKRYFPNKYKFYSCEWVSGIIIRKVILPVDDQSYFHFAGNVYCVPFEKENIFINAVRAL